MALLWNSRNTDDTLVNCNNSLTRSYRQYCTGLPYLKSGKRVNQDVQLELPQPY